MSFQNRGECAEFFKPSVPRSDPYETPKSKDVGGLGLLLILSPMAASTRAVVGADDPSKRVKIIGGGVELIEITPTAEKCGKQKGETIRLRVTSETPIDVRIYMLVAWHQWISADFPNQKKGAEISSFVAIRNRITRYIPTGPEVRKPGRNRNNQK